MDFTPPLSADAGPISVPFLGMSCPTPGCVDLEEFMTFPQRAGYDDVNWKDLSCPLPNRTPIELAILVQSWLYFGTLEAFTASTIDREACLEDTCGGSIGNRQVSSARVRLLLEAWLDANVVNVAQADGLGALLNRSLQPVTSYWRWGWRRGAHVYADRLPRMRKLVYCVWVATETLELLEQANDDTLVTILLSVKILALVLQLVITGSYRDLPWRVQSSQVSKGAGSAAWNLDFSCIRSGRPPGPTGLLLLERFRRNGWCPYKSMQMCRYDPLVVYYLTRLPNHTPSHISHESCTTDKCVGSNANMDAYTTRHTSSACACDEITMPAAKIRTIIAQGGIPLISVKPSSDRSSPPKIRVARMSFRTPYIAFSHVWADGLGNPHRNGLPKCQLLRLSSLAISARDPREHFERNDRVRPYQRLWSWYYRDNPEPFESSKKFLKCEYFWLDTLCIPVGDDAQSQHLKGKAIEMMHTIYAAALQVVVLDSGLEDQSLKSMPRPEILARLVSSAWMGRSWTLQEGAINPHCQVRFGGQTLSTKTLADFRWRVCHPGDKLRPPLDRLYLSTGGKPPALVRTLEEWTELHFSQALSGKLVSALKNDRGAATSLPSFVRVYNELRVRSTTKPEDVHLILANLLDYEAGAVQQLHDPAERMKALLWSLNRVPFSLLCTPDSARCRATEYHANRWMPLYPSGAQILGGVHLGFADASKAKLRFAGYGGTHVWSICCSSESIETWPPLALRLDVVFPPNDEKYSVYVHFHRAPGDVFYEGRRGPLCFVLDLQTGSGCCFLVTSVVWTNGTQTDPSNDLGWIDGAATHNAIYDCPVTCWFLQPRLVNQHDATAASVRQTVSACAPSKISMAADPPLSFTPLPRLPAQEPQNYYRLMVSVVNACLFLIAAFTFGGAIFCFCYLHMASETDAAAKIMIAVAAWEGVSLLQNFWQHYSAFFNCVSILLLSAVIVLRNVTAARGEAPSMRKPEIIPIAIIFGGQIISLLGKTSLNFILMHASFDRWRDRYSNKSK